MKEYENILEIKDAILLCRIRTTNIKLPIETGRWQNIPRENRKSILCNRFQIGDEYHYIFECHYLNQKQCPIISYIDIQLLNFLNLCQVEEN